MTTVLRTLQLTPPLRGVASECCCPSAAGRCRAPYDVQPASLARPLRSLDPREQAAVVLSGSILEHLRDGDPLIAAHHAARLVTLLDLV